MYSRVFLWNANEATVEGCVWTQYVQRIIENEKGLWVLSGKATLECSVKYFVNISKIKVKIAVSDIVLCL